MYLKNSDGIPYHWIWAIMFYKSWASTNHHLCFILLKLIIVRRLQLPKLLPFTRQFLVSLVSNCPILAFLGFVCGSTKLSREHFSPAKCLLTEGASEARYSDDLSNDSIPSLLTPERFSANAALGQNLAHAQMAYPLSAWNIQCYELQMQVDCPLFRISCFPCLECLASFFFLRSVRVFVWGLRVLK